MLKEARVVRGKAVASLFLTIHHHELTKKVGLTANKTTAAIATLNVKSDPDRYKEIAMGKVNSQRYSQNAITKIMQLVDEKGTDQIWAKCRAAPLALGIAA